jgi:hypothetical protein
MTMVRESSSELSFSLRLSVADMMNKPDIVLDVPDMRNNAIQFGFALR